VRKHPRKPKPDLDEDISLYPLDPEDVLRHIVQEPDKRDEKAEESTKP